MNAYIIGFMGAGKSTLARHLANTKARQSLPPHALGRLPRRSKAPLALDTDSLIQGREGRSIANIFQSDGEAYFRKKECEVLVDIARLGGASGARFWRRFRVRYGIGSLCYKRDFIISTGGGIIEYAPSYLMLKRAKKSASIIYLNTPFSLILKRIAGDATRPNAPLARARYKHRRARYLSLIKG